MFINVRNRSIGLHCKYPKLRKQVQYRVVLDPTNNLCSLSQVFQKGFDSAVKRNNYPESVTSIESTPAWLTFLNPSLFPRGKTSLSYLGDTAAVYLTLLTAASRPQPQYSLIVRVCSL